LELVALLVLLEIHHFLALFVLQQEVLAVHKMLLAARVEWDQVVI
tara:strand:+ start:9305 stop:9439 length:135 start_codon:yes stop_codon:yes gene_type:complete